MSSDRGDLIMINSILTTHAKKRCQQRGITSDVIQCIRTYGEESYSTKGGSRYQLTRRSQQDALTDGCYDAQTIEHSWGIYVIAYGSTEATWAHCTGRPLRDLKRRDLKNQRGYSQ